ncbi:hypothetical protein [Ruegeria hyattellae]|uniref:hypothetical protein n=1 Tax=Ruegeria hyattellae TaxID=3233337 RepID=UPI00355B92D5
MQTPFPQILTKSLNALDDQARCADAVHLLSESPIPRDVAEWLSETVERLVRDDELALDLHVCLSMASNGNAHG